MDIFDLLLLPKKLYKRLSDKKYTLLIGIILVGVADLVFPLIVQFSDLFTGKSIGVMYFNISLALVLILFIGFLDVVCFTIPVFDVLRLFIKGKNSEFKGDNLVKLMKVYVLANFMIVPINLIFYILYRDGSSLAYYGGSGWVVFLIFLFLPAVWISGIVARGASVIFNFESGAKKAVFMVALTWGYILSSVLSFIISNWAMTLFR